MRKPLFCAITFFVLILVLAVSSAYADKQSAYTLRVSYYDPESAEAGFTFGGSAGAVFDDVVTLGVGTDVYYRNFKKDTKVADVDYLNGDESALYMTEIQYTTLIVPIMAELSVRIPIVWKLSIFGHGGLGFDVMWAKEENYDTGSTDNRWYAGFAWMGGAGLSIKLGTDTALYAEGFYKHSKVKRNRDDLTVDMPVFEEVDLSGLGVRLGVALEL
jgi:hypothetical protein